MSMLAKQHSQGLTITDNLVREIEASITLNSVNEEMIRRALEEAAGPPEEGGSILLTPEEWKTWYQAQLNSSPDTFSALIQLNTAVLGAFSSESTESGTGPASRPPPHPSYRQLVEFSHEDAQFQVSTAFRTVHYADERVRHYSKAVVESMSGSAPTERFALLWHYPELDDPILLGIYSPPGWGGNENALFFSVAHLPSSLSAGQIPPEQLRVVTESTAEAAPLTTTTPRVSPYGQFTRATRELNFDEFEYDRLPFDPITIVQPRNEG